MQFFYDFNQNGNAMTYFGKTCRYEILWVVFSLLHVNGQTQQSQQAHCDFAAKMPVRNTVNSLQNWGLSLGKCTSSATCWHISINEENSGSEINKKVNFKKLQLQLKGKVYFNEILIHM
jgi:hypothetical protein